MPNFWLPIHPFQVQVQAEDETERTQPDGDALDNAVSRRLIQFFSVFFLWRQNAELLEESIPYWGFTRHMPRVAQYIWVHPRGTAVLDRNYV